MYDDDNDYGNYNWDPDHNMWVDYTAEQFTGENPYLGYPEYEDYSENNAAEDYNDTNLNRGSDSNSLREAVERKGYYCAQLYALKQTLTTLQPNTEPYYQCRHKIKEAKRMIRANTKIIDDIITNRMVTEIVRNNKIAQKNHTPPVQKPAADKPKSTTDNYSDRNDTKFSLSNEAQVRLIILSIVILTFFLMYLFGKS